MMARWDSICEEKEESKIAPPPKKKCTKLFGLSTYRNRAAIDWDGASVGTGGLAGILGAQIWKPLRLAGGAVNQAVVWVCNSKEKPKVQLWQSAEDG